MKYGLILFPHTTDVGKVFIKKTASMLNHGLPATTIKHFTIRHSCTANYKYMGAGFIEGHLEG